MSRCFVISEIKTDSEAQKARSQGGQDYENDAFWDLVNGFEECPSISVIRPNSSVRDNTDIAIPTQMGSFVPSVDILIKKDGSPAAAIFAMKSLRERVRTPLYELSLLRKRYPAMIGIICLMDTSDELGSDEYPRLPRIMALDANVRIFVDNPRTAIGINVRPREELVGYLKASLGL